jgi:hypothetical protein
METAKRVAKLRPRQDLKVAGTMPRSRIPFFAVGYKGWSTISPMAERLDPTLVNAILVIENGLFASAPDFGGLRLTGPAGLWGLIACLQQATECVASLDLYAAEYGRGPADGERSE